MLPSGEQAEGIENRGLGGLFEDFGRQLQNLTEGVCGGGPNRPAGGVGEGNWTQQWMKTYAPAIADLKLDDMSIPGTHDSGTAKMVMM